VPEILSQSSKVVSPCEDACEFVCLDRRYIIMAQRENFISFRSWLFYSPGN
jgi:hypothetical protein